MIRTPRLTVRIIAAWLAVALPGTPAFAQVVAESAVAARAASTPVTVAPAFTPAASGITAASLGLPTLSANPSLAATPSISRAAQPVAGTVAVIGTPAAKAAAASPASVAAPAERRASAPAVVAAETKAVTASLQAVQNAPEASEGGTYAAGAALEASYTRTARSNAAADLAPVTGNWGSLKNTLGRAGAGVAALTRSVPSPFSGTRFGTPKSAVYGVALVAAGLVLAGALGITGAWLPAAWTSIGLLALTGTVAGPTPAADDAAAKARAELQTEVEGWTPVLQGIQAEVGKVIVGQKDMLDAILMAMILGEHVLLEGVPGVAKTQAVKAFADATEGQFTRVQGTPDKLPSDIIGAEVLQDVPTEDGGSIKKIVLEKGPIFTQILLVDEINRMMPKTQAALLEAMQEGRVTIGGQTLPLPKPFIVLATQNPLEQEGVYRLPEAQQDRFIFKALVPMPTRDQLEEIMRRFANKENQPQASKITTLEQLVQARRTTEKITVSAEIDRAIANIVDATHNPGLYGLELKGIVDNGASPRAAINLRKAARAHALFAGRSWVEREDLAAVAPLILRHRLQLSFKAQSEGVTADDVVAKVLASKAVWGEQEEPVAAEKKKGWSIPGFPRRITDGPPTPSGVYAREQNKTKQ